MKEPKQRKGPGALAGETRGRNGIKTIGRYTQPAGIAIKYRCAAPWDRLTPTVANTPEEAARSFAERIARLCFGSHAKPEGLYQTAPRRFAAFIVSRRTDGEACGCGEKSFRLVPDVEGGAE